MNMYMYHLYVEGRDKLGLTFKQHRTHKAFTEASISPWLAWKHACADNAKAGNPLLPGWFKAALEILGVGLVALYWLKPWQFLAVLAVVALSQTASEQESGGGSIDYNDELLQESGRLGRLFDNIADQTELPAGFEWPDCDCTECRTRCKTPAALPTGGLCTNCAMGFHK